MKLLSWNCRGIGDPAIVRELRDLVEISSPAILCLVETQLQKSRVEGLRFSLGYDFSFGVGSSGRSGSLCIFWKNSVDVVIKKSEYHVMPGLQNQGWINGGCHAFTEKQPEVYGTRLGIL